MKKVLVVFGTRPEAIKMCPLVLELKKRKNIEVFVCVSGQHKELLDSVMAVFALKADFDLEIMSKEQTLFDVTEKILGGIKKVICDVKPDLILVHGDTCTSFTTALAAFYLGIPIGHVEAGLRSNDILEPFPEEFYRRAISLISTFDFAPTELSKNALVNEGKKKVYLTGNTVLDSFKYTLSSEYDSTLLSWAKDKKMILLTTHRRENIGKPMKSIFSAVKRIASERDDVCFVCPLHPNPVISNIAKEHILDCSNVKICEPFNVIDFHNTLSRCYFTVTDSGGIQEEGIALSKPILVLRNKTERPEGVLCGGLKLIGTDEIEIYKNILNLLDNEKLYKKMSKAKNPFGDGNASKKISDIIEKSFDA